MKKVKKAITFLFLKKGKNNFFLPCKTCGLTDILPLLKSLAFPAVYHKYYYFMSGYYNFLF